ncbi:hypothetical protein [Spirillospora sp. NPDC048819]|uniref:hypothetical protein n=1 Tax=Spirillospora sp. NPDC048819 TaxID=3155268 RepID=UPI0033F69EA3
MDDHRLAGISGHADDDILIPPSADTMWPISVALRQLQLNHASCRVVLVPRTAISFTSLSAWDLVP